MDDDCFFNHRGTVHLRDHNDFVTHKKQFTGDIHFFNRLVRVTCNDKEYSIPYENIVYIEMQKQPTLERF